MKRVAAKSTGDRNVKFTKRNLDALSPPLTGKQVYYSDSLTRYLQLSIGRAGTKTFVFYKTGGRDSKKAQTWKVSLYDR